MLNTQCVILWLRERSRMDYSGKIKALNIPYRTVTDWEHDTRHAPDYVLRLLEYYIQMEGLIKDKQQEDRSVSGVTE